MSLAGCHCSTSSCSGSNPPCQQQWFHKFLSGRSHSCQISSKGRASSARGWCPHSFQVHQTCHKYQSKKRLKIKITPLAASIVNTMVAGRLNETSLSLHRRGCHQAKGGQEEPKNRLEHPSKPCSSGPWQWPGRYIDPDCTSTYWWEGHREGQEGGEEGQNSIFLGFVALNGTRPYVTA